MTTGVESLVLAFEESNRRLAVIDQEVRRHLGQWQLGKSVPASEIIGHLEPQDRLWKTEGKLVIPLHEEDSAELTGEYVEYFPGRSPPTIAFFEFSTGQRKHITLEEFGRSWLGWRTRFWHPDYEPPELPSFLEDPTNHHGTREFTTTVDTPMSQPRSGRGIFSELRESVNQERQKIRDTRRAAFRDLDFREYKNKFGGLGALESKGRHHNEQLGQVCVLAVRNPEWSEETSDTITEGMEVLIGAKGTHPGFPVKAKVEDINGSELEFGVYWDSSSDKSEAERAFAAESEASFEMGILLDPEYFEEIEDSIETVENNPIKAGTLRGEAEPEFTEPEADPVSDPDLNATQQDAMTQAVHTDSVYCVHGPPATGKTRTLSAIIGHLVEKNNRVLACAPNPERLDELLFMRSTPERSDSSSLHGRAQNGELTLARRGETSSHPVESSPYDEIPTWKGDVVGATTAAAGEFRSDEFDWAVIDDSNEATIAESVIPYAKAERVILAGDHRQLPPRYPSDRGDEGVEISLFEYLVNCYGTEVKSTLKKQYRMNERIAEFPNMTFYAGELQHGIKNRRWSIRELSPLEAIDISGREMETPSGSYYNTDEVQIVKDEVSRLLDRGVKPSEIGVITPYSGQVGKIRVEVEETTREAEKIHIGTVEAFRHEERDAIIISFVRSNEDHRSGFLTHKTTGPRYLNVILTRAKKRSVLIGDWNTLGGERDNSNKDPGDSIFSQLRAYLSDNGLLFEKDSKANPGSGRKRSRGD